MLADKVVQTAALDDRRLRKELQVSPTVYYCDIWRLNPIMEENYGKLVDSCVISVSRLDAGTWIRRTTKDTLSAVNGRDSPIPRGTPIVLLGGPFLISTQLLLIRSSKRRSPRILGTINLTPRPRLGSRCPYLPLVPPSRRDVNTPNPGNPVHRPAGRPEHEEIPHGQRQGVGIVYKHGVLHRNP